MNIKIDNIDLSIIKVLSKLKPSESLTTYKLAKKVFPESITLFDKKKANSRLAYRLDKLEQYGIIDKTLYSYELIEDNCWFDKIDTPLMKLKKAVFLKTTQGRIIIEV